MAPIEQIPLIEEWEEKQPSFNRRKERLRGGGRGNSRVRARFLSLIGMSVLLPAAVLYGGYRLSLRLSASPRFVVGTGREIRVENNHIVSRERVLDALGFDDSDVAEGTNLFRMNLIRARRRVEQLPWIKSATLVRVFPRSLTVRVAERVPLAFASVGGRIELVDRDGMFLELPGKASFDFPVLYGLDSAASTAQRKELLDRTMEFMDETREAMLRSGWTVSEVDLGDPSDLRALLVAGRETVLAHFGDRDFGQRFKTFMRVVPRVLETYPRIASVDLRFQNEVVVDPLREPSSARPKTQPARDARP